MSITYTELAYEDIEYLCNEQLILIVTATDLETSETHKKLNPLPDHTGIIKVYKGALTYFFGIFGEYKVAHVQCSMGSLSRSSSTTTITTALALLRSKVVIMIGIAFGVDRENQNIGDVLVAESIIPYNTKRVGEKDSIQRGIEAPTSKILLNRFRNIKQTWEHFINDTTKAKLILTRLLSGEELVDNLKYRNKLIKENKDSKGGEMEGVGVYAACDGIADWILVKGICDYADGKKGDNKALSQNIAINSALSASLEIFNSTSAFKEFSILPSVNNETCESNTYADTKGVLFDLYDESKEIYYLQRPQDNNFLKKLSQYGIWIYGPSGCGKSNLILRNLIRKKDKFIQVNLAYCIGMEVEDFFKELLYELAASCEGINSQVQPRSFSESIRLLLELLNKHYHDQELIVFVDEIPISTEANYKEFTTKFFSFLISKAFKGGLDKIKFVLSSINNPVLQITDVQSKIHLQLCFISLEYWHSDDAEKLISIIEKELDIYISNKIKIELVKKSMGSPRFIKKFYRSILVLSKTDEQTLQQIIYDTERELNY